jgi:hypothetical protein
MRGAYQYIKRRVLGPQLLIMYNTKEKIDKEGYLMVKATIDTKMKRSLLRNITVPYHNP